MLAARNAFSEAFKQAGPKILEPIYDLEVYVPADYMGDERRGAEKSGGSEDA